MQYEMRKLKERDERKQTLDTRIYHVVRIATKAVPTSTLLKHSRRVSLSGNQVSSVNTITVILIPLSTKGSLPTKEGSPSPAQSCRRRSTPSRRVVDLPASHQCSKGPAHRDTMVGSLKNRSTRISTLLIHSLKR